MHAVLYVCLPRSEARSSLRARQKVREYLTREGFDTELRFSGRCDYFSAGGRWSGQLVLLRLRHEQPKAFGRFWRGYGKAGTREGEERRFREIFPAYRGRLPIWREVDPLGMPDDAQIMDESLFRQLRKGFTKEVEISESITDPKVIFTDDDADFEWPKTSAEAAKFWVVIIDYHF